MKGKNMTTALVLSGGMGLRLGSEIPKQYIEVKGKPIVIFCLERFVQSNDIHNIQIVADDSWQEKILKWMQEYNVTDKFKGFSLPGTTRQLSIFNGISDIIKYSQDDDFVLIHDAARPCISEELIQKSIEAIDGHDGVLPVLPMKDTVYLSTNGNRVSSLLNRNQVYAGQAPETFLLGKYFHANQRLITYIQGEKGEILMNPDSKIFEINGSTEPAIMAGLDITMIPGDEGNLKITTKGDLDRFKELLER